MNIVNGAVGEVEIDDVFDLPWNVQAPADIGNMMSFSMRLEGFKFHRLLPTGSTPSWGLPYCSTTQKKDGNARPNWGHMLCRVWQDEVMKSHTSKGNCIRDGRNLAAHVKPHQQEQLHLRKQTSRSSCCACRARSAAKFWSTAFAENSIACAGHADQLMLNLPPYSHLTAHAGYGRQLTSLEKPCQAHLT